jgi:putative addiction module killer protein
VEVYVTPGGRSPFDDWLNGLRDRVGRSAIDIRINKLRRGLIGEYDDVGDGVIELKFGGAGPGYRIYCVDDGRSTLILWGGTKRTQKADIVKAKSYWTAYQREG